MKLADWLLLAFGLLLLSAICATIARADEATATMSWQQWRNLLRQCHVRASGPVTFPTPQPLVGTIISITFSGSAEDITCAQRLLAPTPGTP